MRRMKIESGKGFHVIANTERSQAAAMVLSPGDATGGPDNRHEKSDQWLMVISGTGTAIVNGQEIALSPGMLLLIEAGETHEIRAGGTETLRTFNVYSPPAYPP